MSLQRHKLSTMALMAVFSTALLGHSPGAFAQQPSASSRVIGSVISVSGDEVSVKTDTGTAVSVTLLGNARILRTAPGQKTLSGATKITVSDIASGDRVLMVVAGTPPAASIVVVNKQADIAAKQQQEEADWQHRGVGGIVQAADATTGAVTIVAGTRTIVIHTTPATIIRRYAPDSVKFSDAKPSTLAAMQRGDQLTARGDRTPAGTEMTADEIVSGSFRNIAGTVVSINAAAGTFVVKDLGTKKTVTIRTTADTDLRRVEPQVAQEIAMRLKTRGNGARTVPAGASAARSSAPEAGHQQPGAPGGGNGNGLARALEHSPEIHVADLHKGDAVMIVATAGSPDEATAIRLADGVEPMLEASAKGSQSMFSSAWSLGGGSGGEGGDQGGASNP